MGLLKDKGVAKCDTPGGKQSKERSQNVTKEKNTAAKATQNR